MKKISFTILIAIIFAHSACEESDLPKFEEVSGGLQGSWLLYERGYSPGDRYIVEQVPSHPAKYIVFLDNKRMIINLDGNAGQKFYKVLEDPDPAFSQPVIAFFDREEELDNATIDNLNESYMMTLSENNLKLSFRYCIEGCHMAFKRVANTD
jgi:hypothetical protein